MDERTNTVRSVVWLPDAVRDQCQASTLEHTYLVCTTIRSAIQIWRYDPQWPKCPDVPCWHLFRYGLSPAGA